MIEKILDPETWIPQPIQDQLSRMDQPDKSSGETSNNNAWNNSGQLLSPLAVYSFLKTRFGPPNGYIMYLKSGNADNLIHWHYAFSCHNAAIQVLGKTSGLEILIRLEPNETLTADHWEQLIAHFRACFKKHKKAIKETQAEFEHWSLFINPFVRIANALQYYITQLEKLNLEEPIAPDFPSKEATDHYLKSLNAWTVNITNATSLAATIRMLCPVMAEAFINLVILVFCKDEFRSDDRLYQHFLRQQIDIRVKTLHVYCQCFAHPIDSGTKTFKNFHTLMNNRNDILHGNVDPYKLLVEDVWFDQRYIPLFEKDGGLIKRMMRNYSKNAEREEAFCDFQTISDLIELILMAMDDKALQLFSYLMRDKMPGINKHTKKLGNLFPVTHSAEIFASF